MGKMIGAQVAILGWAMLVVGSLSLLMPTVVSFSLTTVMGAWLGANAVVIWLAAASVIRRKG